MAEEAAPVPVSVPAEAEKMEESAAPSTSATPDECDVDNEAKKLMGAGRRHLVMKDIRSAVNAFQEASSILGKKYGETADQCADAFFSYGMALLELARMENGVLGNALEGMPEDEENGEKEEDPNIPSAANLDEKERDQLREQVYDAMAEKEEKSEEAKTEGKKENGDVAMEEGDKPSEGKEADKPSEDKECGEAKTNGEAAVLENGDKAEKKEAAEEEKKEGAVTEEKTAEESKAEDKGAEEPKNDASTAEGSKVDEKSAEESKPEEKSEASEKTEDPAKETASKEQPAEGDVDKPEGDEPMDGEEEGDAESEDGENEGAEENEGTEEKETDEDEVGNLQLAWEMLDLSKIIFKRQDNKEAQLKAAQAHLKLGEVSVESENYSQAIEDFLACLNIQKEHLDSHDRLLAETNYQLGLAYQYSSKHEDAISHFTQSIDVIEKRMAMLTEQVEKAAGETNEELQKEMEELKGLLPDIKEKIEDSKEAQKTADATEKALKETLVGGSSGFSQENGSTSTTAAPVEKSGDSTVPITNCVSDISHLVRKKRKPEEESPQKEAKKSKAEAVENGSGNGDAVVPTNEEVEKAEEAEKQTPMETTAVESTA